MIYVYSYIRLAVIKYLMLENTFHEYRKGTCRKKEDGNIDERIVTFLLNLHHAFTVLSIIYPGRTKCKDSSLKPIRRVKVALDNYLKR